jgi:hypothetical protein
VIAQPANMDILPDIDLRDGLPHRAVTPYLDTLPPATVRVYDEAVVDVDPGMVNCPRGADASPPPPPATNFDDDCTDDVVPCLFQVEYDPSSLVDGGFYTLVVQGFQDNTDKCQTLTGPADCPAGEIATQLVEDETAEDVVAGSSRVRFFHGVMNAQTVDLCYDLDGLEMNAASPTAIHTNIAPGTMSDYVTAAPVTTGMVFLTVKNPLDATTLTGACALSATDAANGLPSNVIPVFFSAAAAATSDETPGISAGSVLTIFATGDVDEATPPADPGNDPIGVANFRARAPLPLAFYEVSP